MRFLIDAMLPREFAIILKNHGHEARHVKRIKLSTNIDDAIWEAACANKEIVISKDRDFVQLAKSDVRTRFVWYRLRNETFDQLVSSFVQRLPQILLRLQSEDQIVEIT
jgi:predicted nuclease of predicted toxin-antitoxin system